MPDLGLQLEKRELRGLVAAALKWSCAPRVSFGMVGRCWGVGVRGCCVVSPGRPGAAAHALKVTHWARESFSEGKLDLWWSFLPARILQSPPQPTPPVHPRPPPTPVRAGGYRLEGALGEQLPGGAVSRPGVSLWARREDGGEAFSGAALPPLHHARYSGAFPRVRVLGWGGWLWGQWGTLGMRPWVSPPCPRFLPQLFPSQPKLPQLRPSCSLPAGAPSISTTKLGLRGCPGGPGAVLEFLENPENRKQKDEIFIRACEPSCAQGGEGLFARSKCLGGPEVPKRG